MSRPPEPCFHHLGSLLAARSPDLLVWMHVVRKKRNQRTSLHVGGWGPLSTNSERRQSAQLLRGALGAEEMHNSTSMACSSTICPLQSNYSDSGTLLGYLCPAENATGSASRIRPADCQAHDFSRATLSYGIIAYPLLRLPRKCKRLAFAT